MIQGSFRNRERVRGIGEKRAHYTLQSRKLRREPRCGLRVTVEPSFEIFDLVGEVKSGGTESGRVESSFF